MRVCGEPVYRRCADGYIDFEGYETIEIECDICGNECEYNEYFEADLCNTCASKLEDKLIQLVEKVKEAVQGFESLQKDYGTIVNRNPEADILIAVKNIINQHI